MQQQPQLLKLGSLTICHPYSPLFKDQVEHLRHLHREITNERMVATETQHSFAKVVLLFAYFLAYLQQHEGKQYTRIVYLSKSSVQIEEAKKAITIVREVRRTANLPTSTTVEEFKMDTASEEAEAKQPTGTTIVLATIREYVNAALYHSLYTTPRRTILYINECDTLDLQCQQIFDKDISWMSIYHAMEERDYLQSRYLPIDDDFDTELRVLSESLKDLNFQSDQISFLADDRKLLGLLRYVLNFFKYRQKQLELAKRRVGVTRKITEFVVNELEGELFLRSQLLENLRKYFLLFLKKHGIDERSVSKLLSVCEFLETVIIVRRQFESENKNAFRMFSNCRSEHQNYIYRLVCIDPKILFGRIYPQQNKQGSSKYPNQHSLELNSVLLVLNSYSCLQKDFFFSHFKLQISISTFVSKEIAAENILSMSVVCNAFDVDLKSDDYESDNKLQVQRSYGTLIEELTESIPDGIIVFISSYRYLLTLIGEWTRQKILDKIRANKMVFFEVENQKQNEQNIELFRKSCDFGRGGIFFINVRSKALEKAEFKGHYSNLVVFLGYPVISEVEAHTKEKLDYLNEKQKAKEYDYLEQDAMRHVNKWMVGLVGDSRSERKIMLFADARYSMTMVPAWMEVADGNLSISTAIEKCKEFYRKDSLERVASLIRSSLYIG